MNDLYNYKIIARDAFGLKQTSIKKITTSIQDKLFYYYSVKIKIPIYAHKTFIIIEMQLNALLTKAKLIPFIFIAEDICFYRLVRVNIIIISNPYHITALYDTVSISVDFYNQIYYRNYRLQRYPTKLAIFFKRYWAYIFNYTQNKIWLLSNFINNGVTAEVLIFDYPNLILYSSPFTRFTNLYYRNQPNIPQDHFADISYTHQALKLKLFEYAAFYK